MKYAIILGDGMADHPLQELNGKTPLQCSHKPVIDRLAAAGVTGMVKTVPEGMPAGSDTANLAVLGYDPEKYYFGRSPFEAASMGIALKESDVSFRCNLVTLSGEEPYEEKTMCDHSAGEITTEEGRRLLAEVGSRLGGGGIKFYPGIGYRHLMIWEEGPFDWQLTPPHDILGQKIGKYLPRGGQKEAVERMMRESVRFLPDHPVNRDRKSKGLPLANAIWIWGEGKKPVLQKFCDKYGLQGAVISAVDLVRGLGICAGLDIIEVEGADGTLHTNYRGKAMAAVKALKEGLDFVYIHVEAPDECSHHGELENKIKAIEYIDQQVAGVLCDELDRSGLEYRLMVLPDHATPLSLRTHTRDAVPFLIYQSGNPVNNPQQTFDEVSAAASPLFFEEGHLLMDFFLQKTSR